MTNDTKKELTLDQLYKLYVNSIQKGEYIAENIPKASTSTPSTLESMEVSMLKSKLNKVSFELKEIQKKYESMFRSKELVDQCITHIVLNSPTIPEPFKQNFFKNYNVISSKGAADIKDKEILLSLFNNTFNNEKYGELLEKYDELRIYCDELEERLQEYEDD